MRPTVAVALLAVVGLLALAPPALAQDAPRIRLPQDDPDFLFEAPAHSVSIRAGWLTRRANSDWYRFVGDQLTIDDGAFNAPSIGFDVTSRVTSRVDVVVAVDYGSRTVQSEYRDYVDNNRLPINQDTTLRGADLSGGVRVALTERGRQVGRFAWVPRTVVPYVGGGVGAHWYRVAQLGDFVDFQDLSVFADAFEATGWAPSVHALGGADIALGQRLQLALEARYRWVSSDLGSPWIGFEPLDLSGLQITAGVRFPF